MFTPHAHLPDAVSRPEDSPPEARPTFSGLRTALAEKILLDRYALKSTDLEADLRLGSIVVYCPNPDAPERQRGREIGRVRSVDRASSVADIEPRDAPGSVQTVPFESIDLPLEYDWTQVASRVSTAIAAVETSEIERQRARARFERVIGRQHFVPGGRILAGAGVPDSDVTFYNCFVLPSPPDSRAGIIETAERQLEIMSRGGGVGINVSSLRPRYDTVEGVHGRSSGAVSWADLYSLITGKVEQGGSRRGALMIVLDVWHPEIEAFVQAKREPGVLENANISVAVSDAFMDAVENDLTWDLVFPDRGHPDYDAIWDGDLEAWQAADRPVRTYRTISARRLWEQICESAWASAEPGLLFVDQVNRFSNSRTDGALRCSNPCGEQPLPTWGVCNLGALNLGAFALQNGKAFWPTIEESGDLEFDVETAMGRIDYVALADAAATGVHFLDNVIDATPHVYPENEVRQKTERRVGLGVMGLAELLCRIGVTYGSPLSLRVVDWIFETIRDAAYLESISLAKRKGSYPSFRPHALFQSEFANSLPESIQGEIRRVGLRNTTLLTVAPTGSTGTMMATSTGIEPYFLYEFERHGRLGTHLVHEAVVEDYARDLGAPPTALPPHFVTTDDLMPEQHAAIMAVAQLHVDSAISKTCNLPTHYTVEDVDRFYRLLHENGCKGGTIYRDGSRDHQVLTKPEIDPTPEAAAAPDRPAPPAIKPLPDRPRQGLTHWAQTPIGRVHVTLNVDPDDPSAPFDLFIRLSKAGSDTDADTDAIGRLLSLLLRLNVEIPARKRLELALEQLRGIATSRSVGFGPERVRSVPDGIALCLERLLAELSPELEGPPRMAEPLPAAPPPSERPSAAAYLAVCPECGNTTAAQVDGCFKCFACDFSEC